MAYAYLEFCQTNSQKALYSHGENLCICLRGIISHALHAHLCGLFESAAEAGIVDEGVACVAKAYHFLLRVKIGGTGSGYGRGEVRAKHQGIALSVKKFIKIPGGNGSHFLAEYFEIFKGGSLYIFKSILMEYVVKLLLKPALSAAFLTVNVPYSFRRMKNPLHIIFLHVVS